MTVKEANDIINNIRSDMQDIRPVYEAIENGETDLSKKFVLNRIIFNIDKTLEIIEEIGEITDLSETNEAVERARECQSTVIELMDLYYTLITDGGNNNE